MVSAWKRGQIDAAAHRLQPFEHRGGDRTGLGLGLSIAREGVETLVAVTLG